MFITIKVTPEILASELAEHFHKTKCSKIKHALVNNSIYTLMNYLGNEDLKEPAKKVAQIFLKTLKNYEFPKFEDKKIKLSDLENSFFALIDVAEEVLKIPSIKKKCPKNEEVNEEETQVFVAQPSKPSKERRKILNLLLSEEDSPYTSSKEEGDTPFVNISEEEVNASFVNIPDEDDRDNT